MDDSEDPLGAAVRRHIAADEALYNGDPEPRIAMWSTRDPVTLFSAGGERISGHTEVALFFRVLANKYSNASDVSLDIEALEISENLAYTVGIERFSASLSNGPVRTRTIRATQIYRLEDDLWRIVHRHGDPLDWP